MKNIKVNNDIVLMGPPYCGKGTHSEILLKMSLFFLYICTGDMLRSFKNKDTFIRMKKIMDSGGLVPDEFVNGLVTTYLMQHFKEGLFLLFDGWPRNVSQVELFIKIMKFYEKNPIIIFINVGEEELIKRLDHRMIQQSRSDDKQEVGLERIKIYNEITLPAKQIFELHYPVYSINGNGSVPEVNQRILKCINR